MNLIPIEIDSIRIGYPLPCDLVDKDGVLLAKKSFVVRSKDGAALQAALVAVDAMLKTMTPTTR